MMYSRKNRAQCGITYLTRLTKDEITCLTPLDVLASRLHTTSQKQSTLTLDAVGRGRDCVHRPRHDVVTPSFFDRDTEKIFFFLFVILGHYNIDIDSINMFDITF